MVDVRIQIIGAIVVTGSFEIAEISAGEYLVRTQETESYPPASRNVTAPAEDIDLLLFEEVDFEISGLITDIDGLPVPGASVISSARGARGERGEDGSYSTGARVRLEPEGRVLVLARAKGYLEQEFPIQKKELIELHQEGQSTLTLDFMLEPEGEVSSAVLWLHGFCQNGLVEVTCADILRRF